VSREETIKADGQASVQAAVADVQLLDLDEWREQLDKRLGIVGANGWADGPLAEEVGAAFDAVEKTKAAHQEALQRYEFVAGKLRSVMLALESPQLAAALAARIYDAPLRQCLGKMYLTTSGYVDGRYRDKMPIEGVVAWKVLKADGATDTQIRTNLQKGFAGVLCARAEGYELNGGKVAQFIHLSKLEGRKAILSGDELTREVRRVLSLPQPKAPEPKKPTPPKPEKPVKKKKAKPERLEVDGPSTAEIATANAAETAGVQPVPVDQEEPPKAEKKRPAFGQWLGGVGTAANGAGVVIDRCDHAWRERYERGLKPKEALKEAIDAGEAKKEVQTDEGTAMAPADDDSVDAKIAKRFAPAAEATALLFSPSTAVTTAGKPIPEKPEGQTLSWYQWASLCGNPEPVGRWLEMYQEGKKPREAKKIAERWCERLQAYIEIELSSAGYSSRVAEMFRDGYTENAAAEELQRAAAADSVEKKPGDKAQTPAATAEESHGVRSEDVAQSPAPADGNDCDEKDCIWRKQCKAQPDGAEAVCFEMTAKVGRGLTLEALQLTAEDMQTADSLFTLRGSKATPGFVKPIINFRNSEWAYIATKPDGGGYLLPLVMPEDWTGNKRKHNDRKDSGHGEYAGLAVDVQDGKRIVGKGMLPVAPFTAEADFSWAIDLDLESKELRDIQSNDTIYTGRASATIKGMVEIEGRYWACAKTEVLGEDYVEYELQELLRRDKAAGQIYACDSELPGDGLNVTGLLVTDPDGEEWVFGPQKRKVRTLRV
jgi:hypothetical protein